MIPQGLIIYVWTFYASSFCTDVFDNRMILSSFKTLNNLEIQHLAIDCETGGAEILYVGSTNFLYRLDSNLTILEHYKTGPEMDSPYCNYNGDCMVLPSATLGRQQANKSLTDNFNKILLISNKNRSLISCGSLRQGVCTVFRIDDFSQRILAHGDAPQIPVASNTFNASTVAFEDPKSGALFVGTSYTLEPYRFDFPAVATRSLNSRNLFHLKHQDPVSQSAMLLRSEHRMDFKIHYVYGFVSSGFAYWVTVQRESLSHGAPFVSKLARVCADDLTYESYAEVLLECLGSDNSKYAVINSAYYKPSAIDDADSSRDRLWVIFTKFDAANPRARAPAAALCSFTVKEIEATFWFNVDRCSKGVGYWNLPHFGLNQKCVKLQNLAHSKTPGGNQCRGIRVGGTLPMTGVSIFTHGNGSSSLTTVLVDVVKMGAVVFLGTTDGVLKKVSVDSPNSAREYGSIQATKSHVPITSLALSKDRQYLYAVAYNQIIKIKTENCSSYSTCDACLLSGDPYCGWCSLENKCSSEMSCSGYSNDDYSFFRPGDMCLKITKIIPSFAPLTADTVGVKIELNYIPKLNAGQVFYCDSPNNASSMAVLLPPNSLACSIQKPQSIKGADGKIDIPVDVRLNVGKGAIQRFNFSFFDCTSFKSCTDCLSSHWPCDWCISGNRCIYQTDSCSDQVRIRHARALSSGANTLLHADSVSHYVNGTYDVNPVSQCPHISSRSTAEILIPESYPNSISVDVVNMHNVENLAGKDIFCIITVRGQETKVKGDLEQNGKIARCEPYTYFYPTDEQTYVADFRLETNAGAIIDRLNVKLFKCEAIGLDCTQCSSAPRMYNCAWCRDQCRYGPSCATSTDDYQDDQVISRNDPACPAPFITDFEPTAGPWPGGTVLKIRGRDFGPSKPSAGARSSYGAISNIYQSEIGPKLFDGTTGDLSSVLVAGVPCQILAIDETWQSFSCLTGAAAGPVEGPIVFRRSSGEQGASAGAFRFVEPSLDGFQPNAGPKSGGTKISIFGHYLLSATNIEVYLDALPCSVDRAASTQSVLVCYTTSSQVVGQTTVLSIKLDNLNLSFASPFYYVADPTVNGIAPVTTFRSGGRKINVSGDHFHVIQKPLMYLVDADGRSVSETTICQVINSTSMICPSPSLIPGLAKIERQRRSESLTDKELTKVDSSTLSYNIGFQMDNVLSVRNLAHHRLTVLPDPIFEFFSTDRTQRFADPLVIEGRGLNAAADVNDVTVTVGGQPCNVSVLAERHLICRVDALSFNLPISHTKINVHVQMGNLAVDLGFVRFSDAIDASLLPASLDSTLLGSLLGAIGALIVLVTVSLLAWWKRKNWRVERDYKRIQMQMDLLESNVRQECKQAFAELQTDMSDLTGDLVPLNIPFRPYKDFAVKILFKTEQRRLLQTMQNGYLNGYTNTLRASLKQFDSLLGNRHFVLLLVECLEKQATFSGVDRANVGTLLSALLLQNMRYFSDLVFSLLQKLIQKTAADKNPHLMLRRSDSIVEKMLSNWISICAYDYLQQAPGQSLFLLFKALKHQIEKGPVDAVTSEARYCLSEDCLLKQSVVAEPVLLRVIPPNGDYAGGETVLCRVLSCDTIGQVKSKILDTLYRNAPFTSRPSVRDIDLEWRCSGSLHPVLLTERPTSPAFTNAKDSCSSRCLLTVDSYGLPNHSVVGVIPKSCSAGYSSSTSSAGSLHTYASITSSTLLLSRRHAAPPSVVCRSNTTSRGSSKRSDASRNGSPDSAILTGSEESQNAKWWHLVKPDAECNEKNRTGCSIPEVYLTRLLATKGTVQHFIDDFFACVFNVGPSFPPAVKYLFNFLHAEFDRNGFADPQVLNAWKTNSFWLRFWVNFIKNPDFAFDVEKTPTLDACLSVLAQTFMDSCSTSPQRLGKDSPSAKLLFARDVLKYRMMCQKFFGELAAEKCGPQQTQIEIEMSQFLQETEKIRLELSVEPIVHELLAYVMRYKDEILAALSADQISICQQLPQRLEHMYSLLNS